MPDQGKLTLKMAWYEYKFLSLPRRVDKDWPHVEKLKTAFRRRAQMFDLLALKAEREEQTMEALIDAMTVLHQGKTMSKLLLELKAEAKANKLKGNSATEGE